MLTLLTLYFYAHLSLLVFIFVSDIAIFVLKRDVKFQITNLRSFFTVLNAG